MSPGKTRVMSLETRSPSKLKLTEIFNFSRRCNRSSVINLPLGWVQNARSFPPFSLAALPVLYYPLYEIRLQKRLTTGEFDSCAFGDIVNDEIYRFLGDSPVHALLPRWVRLGAAILACQVAAFRGNNDKEPASIKIGPVSKTSGSIKRRPLIAKKAPPIETGDKFRQFGWDASPSGRRYHPILSLQET